MREMPRMSDISGHLNAGKLAHASENDAFEAVFLSEVSGILDTLKPSFGEIFAHLHESLGGGATTKEIAASDGPQQFTNLIYHGFRLKRFSTELPSNSIPATLQRCLAAMKQHAESLVAQLKDPSRWPGFEAVDHLKQLQGLAGEAKGRRTTDGYLAAMLIIHQLTEEMIKILIDDADFYTQLKLYPLPLKATRTKEKGTFGRYLSDLKSTVWFQNKKYIVEKADRLNEIRNSIVHGLTKPDALSVVEQNVTEAWELYSSLSFLALEAHMVFQSDFRDLYQNPDWPPKDTVILRDDGSYLE